MGIEDLTLKSCYIGDREVIKLYKGDTLIYEKSSGGGKIYERNGDLIIPAGTICKIEDFSGGEPVTTEYVLPSDVIISGSNGEVTLSDGQIVRYYAGVEENSYNYNATLKVYTVVDEYGRNRVVDKVYTSSSSELSFEQSWYCYYDTAKADVRIILPDGLFYVKNVTEGYVPNISRYRLRSDYYIKPDNIDTVWLHDYGEVDYFADKILNGSYGGRDYFSPTFGTGKISEDDIPIRVTPSGNFTYYDVEGYNNRIPLKAGHTFCLYGLTKNVRLSSNAFSLPYYTTSRIGYQGERHAFHFNEPLSVTISGYNFGSGVDINAHVSYYDNPDKLGTAKVNEEYKYYDVVPNE